MSVTEDNVKKTTGKKTDKITDKIADQTRHTDTDQSVGKPIDTTGKLKPETPRLDRSDLPPQPNTVPIDDLPGDKLDANWGSGLLSKRANLVFEVPHYGSYLIQVQIDDQTILGRFHPDALNNPDVDLSPFEAQLNGVSRCHAKLIKEDGMLKVVDLDSTNGTYLNGAKLQPNRPRIMRLGDQLSLGKLTLRLTRLA